MTINQRIETVWKYQIIKYKICVKYNYQLNFYQQKFTIFGIITWVTVTPQQDLSNLPAPPPPVSSSYPPPKNNGCDLKIKKGIINILFITQNYKPMKRRLYRISIHLEYYDYS